MYLYYILHTLWIGVQGENKFTSIIMLMLNWITYGMGGLIVNFYKWIMYPMYESLKWQRILVSLPLINSYYVNVTVWAKNSHIRIQIEFILLCQLIATLNNYTCSLPLLANVNWFASPECFFWPCKSTTGGMVPMEGSNLAVGTWYCSFSLHTSF